MDCNASYTKQNYESLKGLSLGSAYVPEQVFDQVLDAEKSYAFGTIFAELIYPFRGENAACCRKRGLYESN